MAPIASTPTGVLPQVLDDPILIDLLTKLNALDLVDNEVNLNQLTELLEPYKSEWVFEETVDLHDWIHPLNVLDSALTWILKDKSLVLLLIPPFAQQQQSGAAKEVASPPLSFTTLEQIQSCTLDLVDSLTTILQFSTELLRNAISKQLYSSIAAVSDLLAAGDDGVADNALALLTALSLPPALHKQQVPEHPVQPSQLHLASSGPLPHGPSGSVLIDVHDRLIATSRAWGTRATGMGLFVTVTADDSIYGQGGLPTAMGEVNFTYYASAASDVDTASTLQEISLTLSDMLVADGYASSPDYSSAGSNVNSNDDNGAVGVKEPSTSKKRRKVASLALDDGKTSLKKDVKSTAELFFLAIEKAGGFHKIPADRWFPLLAEVRLARAFHSQSSRFVAVNRRMRALIAILHAHPSHDVISGYFQAQPELCVEIVDLLRPVVSSANVTATTAIAGRDTSDSASGVPRQDAITNLVSDSIQSVPFEVRMLAVETLTALVSRREGSSGLLSGTPRLPSILIDLGVGKGQYLGLLPTLIRYSLASLSSGANIASEFMPVEVVQNPDDMVDESSQDDQATALNIGLAFVEATMAPTVPRSVQIFRALHFIENVLTLTSSVVGTPTGTAALVDCGLIPALLRTVAMNPEEVLEGLRSDESMFTVQETQRVHAMLRFIIAQAVQILEGSFITHSNALTAFHDLQGVEVLTTRLSREIVCTNQMLSNSLGVKESTKMEIDEVGADVEMRDKQESNSSRIFSSQRVLLFSIVNCLTVVFHHESSSATAAPTGGTQLRKPELTDALLEILRNVNSYGGHLASLIATLLSDIMNSDPHVVHYVHQSGISDAFLDMVIGKKNMTADGKETFEPLVPPVPELITAITNVISALALTEDGATVVAERNPFPSLLRLLYHPEYAMPKSRCLLNDMTGMIGSGLDEIIRHVERLKPLVLTAIADAMNQVVVFAEDLLSREEEMLRFGEQSEAQKGEIEDERSCLIQYVLNFGQVLEQILQNEDNCDPFVDAGGLDAILRLFPLSMPSSVQFLSFITCLSSPSVSTLYHSTIEESLGIVLRCIELRYSSSKLIEKLIGMANALMDELVESQIELKSDGEFSLDVLPLEPMLSTNGQSSHAQLVSISRYLRRVANVQWATGLLANTVKSACQRGGDTGLGWSQTEREWKMVVAGKDFNDLVDRLSLFHRQCLYEVCRARTTDGFERRERQRLEPRTSRLGFRLRVVCSEGAVLRDGIEIDSCTNVGSLEMGDIVDAFDRCINSSGILRYRTNRGWVSEMTRGHGREPIVEVLSIWDAGEEARDLVPQKEKKRIEAGILDLHAVAVSVLARCQASYTDLFVSMSKLVIQGIRTLTLPASFDDGQGLYVASVLKLLALNVSRSLCQESVVKTGKAVLSREEDSHLQINGAGAAMYLGCVLHQLHMCLFEDKRERRMVNFPLLVFLISSDPSIPPSSTRTLAVRNISSDATKRSVLGVFDAVRVVFTHGLADFEYRANPDFESRSFEPEYQRVGRSVAASYPPLIALLRKIVTTPLSSSPAASIMSRMNWRDVSRLLSKDDLGLELVGSGSDEDFFHPETLIADQIFSMSAVVAEVWRDESLLHAPPFLLYPIANLVGDVVLILEDIVKKKSSKNQPRTIERMRLSELLRQQQGDSAVSATNRVTEEQFEASEESISRLMEMGFNRERSLYALESIRSNRVELAMDYALTNDAPSSEAIEQRRVEREERARLRAEAQDALQAASVEAAQDAIRAATVEAARNEPGASVDPDASAMDVEQTSQGQDDQKEPDDSNISDTMAKTELDAWIEAVPTVSLALLNRMPRPSQRRAIQAAGRQSAKEGDGDGESEAVTFVLCSFMLDMCQRFTESRVQVVSSLLSQLKSKLRLATKSGVDHYDVPEESEASVAALCHSAVLITRALPKMRIFVLKEGLVNALTSCLQTCLDKRSSGELSEAHQFLPMWLVPSLLLLDVMSQPIIAFSDKDTVKSIVDTSCDGEFFQVQQEHEDQVAKLFKLCDRWFTASHASGVTAIVDTQPPDAVDNAGKVTDAERFENSQFSTVPAYFPLVPKETSQKCLTLCQTLLGKSEAFCLSPGLAQSVLLLLFRLVQNPEVASKCIHMGVAEAILGLSKESAFTGNTGLATCVFRWLLEDQSTLMTTMETEMRSTVTRLQNANKSSVGGDETSVVSLTSFMEATSAWLCRDPTTFFKAMALSVAIDAPKQKSDTTSVSLLSQTERSSRVESFLKPSPVQDVPTSESKGGENSRQTPNTKAKRKSNSRGPKREATSSKKGKKAETAKPSGWVESPVIHITGLLIHSVIVSVSEDTNEGSVERFFTTESLLEILSDLVLAVPACASAIHNFRPHRSKDKLRKIFLTAHLHHALSHCQPPPKNFVTFLLHNLLPQDRWTIRNDPQIWSRRKDSGSDEAAAVETKKKDAYRILKVSQAAGRLLVALVVRPGEGRKRVISDLAFAMSGCRLGNGASGTQLAESVPDTTEFQPPSDFTGSSSDFHAIQAWAEVCLGIAAPRSNGMNLDSMASLSIDNIRLMLEHGMVHALLYSLHRVNMLHPMASNTYGTLLLPLEVLTRGSVTDAVNNLVKKEKQPKETADKVGGLPTTAQDVPIDTMEEESIHDGAAELALDGDTETYEIESEMDEADSQREDGNLQIVDEDIGTDDSSDEESGDDDSDNSDDDDDMEEEDEGTEGEDSEEGSSVEVDEEGAWDVGYNNSMFDGQEYEADEEVTDPIEDNIDEGWTRVESNTFAGMLLGERNGVGGFGINNEATAGRSHGFIDAAEAMIGTLLRNGEISVDALAEIEGTLGIRIMQSGRPLRGTWNPSRPTDDGTFADALGARVIGADGTRQNERVGLTEAMGTLPTINQRNPPDVCYSSFGRNGQRVDLSSMEYVYGGPSFTGASRNYDIVTSFNGETDVEQTDEVQLTQLDLQLFPTGPASAAHARTTHSLHPLLSGVDLPPINSLVSDLLPHGLRAARGSLVSSPRPGVWSTFSSGGGYMSSTSNPTLLRTNRPHTGSGLVVRGGNGGRIFAGPVGLPDDGMQLEATVAEFRSALEGALDHSARLTTGRDAQETNPESDEALGQAPGGPSAVNEDAEPGSADSIPDVPMADTAASESTEALQSMQVDADRNRDGVESSLVADSNPSSNEPVDENQDTDMGAGSSIPVIHSEIEETASTGMDEQTAPDDEHDVNQQVLAPESGNIESGVQTEASSGLVCPPDIDLEVFNSLPIEMQQDCVDQYAATQELAAQLDGSSLDPEILAALPEEMRREVIEQERQERRMREQDQSPADPAHAEEMDNASFIASLAPDLREEILRTADDAFLNSLPPGIIAEAQILRERATVQHRRMYDSALGTAPNRENINPGGETALQVAPNGEAVAVRRRPRSGKLKVERDRSEIVFLPEAMSPPFAVADLKTMIRLIYLLWPIQPPRLLQRVFLNLCANPALRNVLTSSFVKLLHEDGSGALAAVQSLDKEYGESDSWRKSTDALFSAQDDFPPSTLLGAAPETPEFDAFAMNGAAASIRRGRGSGTAASLAANLPKGAGGTKEAHSLPPAVAARLVDTLLQLCKSPRFCLHVLTSQVLDESNCAVGSTCFEKLLELLDKPMFANSSGNLEQLLTLLESIVAPLSHVSKHTDEEMEISQRDVDTAATTGKEYVDIPKVVVSQPRLQLLCSILRMESCRDTAFAKVNTIVRRLCRVEMNRGYVLAELASVAHALGADAIRDLRSLRIRMDSAVSHHKGSLDRATEDGDDVNGTKSAKLGLGLAGSISSSVTLSTSTSEMKLLRVLQTLQSLCNDNADDNSVKKSDNGSIVTEELGHLLRQMQFDDLWDELSACLKVVQVLEGVKTFEEEEQKASEDMDINDEGSADDAGGRAKKLRNSAAGLLTRFLPSIEAFFVANASATRPAKGSKEGLVGDEDIAIENLVGGKRMVEFVTTNRVLINALIRNNAGLLDKSLRTLVLVPRCRGMLDFDVKRQWFKTQVRRLRHQASRRHGSLRLHIRRKHVFEDAYHQLQPRNADEMRGRLHVTFRNEEGVDAGGLSREFFGILAKEMFNPNYALFTSTEDGCTFQPNPNSIINPDHLSYFRFVGRVVGKAVADGFLLDAHFTRSLYKHLLGMEPTHHDMEAIDPDYYRNLKTILEFQLSDIGLDLTFSIEDHSFGRSQVIDLLPNGRTIPVTEENKDQYVRLVCQHRMTTAIESQIKSYLAGFYELVSPELIAVFTPRELELLISGLPDIDVHDLKKNTDYAGWKATDKEIEWFWNILFSLSRNEKAAFLQFVTGSSKVPLSGFSELQGMRGIQKFAIHKAGGAKGALMSAHTCFNSLDLPVYGSEEEMREKLLYAINEGGGAFLFA